MVPSDAGLAARFRDANDREAFETLVRRHLPALRRYLAVALVGNAEGQRAAERDTLIRLYSRLASWRAEGPFSTVLCTAARQAAHKWTHRRALPVSGTEAPHRLLHQLSLLPEPERSLLYLSRGEGCSLQQLSAIFSLKETTVAKKLDQARQQWSSMLTEERYA